MYNLMREHLSRGGYKLREVQDKINKLWIDDRLTAEQRDELLGMAQGGAAAENEVDLVAKVAELERRVKVLEHGGNTEGPAEEYPAYVPGKWYYGGDKVTFDGAAYECMAPNSHVCTWSPAEYPAYWNRIN